MSVSISGKKALVTGASSGIGHALARALARAGVELAISARRAEALGRLADEIAGAGGVRPQVLAADLSQRGEAARLGERAEKALGAVDIIVNNAGVGLGGAQWVVGDDEEARLLFETNFWSPLALTRALVPQMRRRGSGFVVNVSSVASVAPMPLTGHYAASKGALAQATETLRMELAGSGVHVLHVLPGPVDTGMLAELKAVKGSDKVMASMPRGTTDELARRVVRALERKRRALVYPAALGLVRHFPTVALRFSGPVMKAIDVEDSRKVLGGSQGDSIAREIRQSFEAQG